ncbi:MAG TPA: OmpA family protein, partial [Myxococcaceae bacterium]|nr:OmpA family protein [Myxococcaceae bacterium]
YEGSSTLFDYLEGYRFVMQGRVTFEARPGSTMVLWSTGFARDGWTLQWQDRPGFRMEGQPQRDILSIESGPPRHESLEQGRAAPAPEVSRGSSEEVQAAPEPGEPCRMEPVQFDFEDSRLRPEAQEALLALSRCLLRQPARRLRLEGHGDARGTESVNVSLGLGRALTVAGYLWSLGVPREQLEVGTRGTEGRVCEERTEACFSRSRRVEFVPLTH